MSRPHRAPLLDERAEPAVRRVIGDLLAGAESAELAIARIRLAALDVTEEEVRSARRCRVLLGQLDATTLLDAAPAGPAPVPLALRPLLRLRAWLASGRLEVRSAGIGAWTPDFSVYTHRSGGASCLLGAHYFGSPQLTVGPSFTMVSHEPDDCAVLRRRFDHLWQRGHDVSPAIAHVLDRAALELGHVDDSG